MTLKSDRAIQTKSMDFIQKFGDLALVSDDDALGSHGPSVSFGHEEAVEVVRGRAFLFDPGAALVG